MGRRGAPEDERGKHRSRRGGKKGRFHECNTAYAGRGEDGERKLAVRISSSGEKGGHLQGLESVADDGRKKRVRVRR